MSRDEALALGKPPEYSRVRSACATGTDGVGWYRTFRMGSLDWTQRLYAWQKALGGVIGMDLRPDEPLDPPGVDWAPGWLEVPVEQLPPLPERP